MASFPNVYTHRKVSETSSKACEICYKPSTSVLVTPENKDFFYVCAGHLKDRVFCTPIIDEAAVAAKKKKAMEAEVERVKLEFEEKQKKQKEKEKEKGKDKEKNEKDAKAEDKKKLEEVEAEAIVVEDEPRVFVLKKAFYQQRINKKRQAEVARRNRERLQNPNLFPQVPKNIS
ncbi:VPS4-associated protein 1 [Calycina marina]|uniref:VPS4-associated protein 1 n=1 Tax=Calycina marina TaxID=1763456 RepID=A0A9P8CD32_9HELO|nr:VPS4-associated protein 1 [Calycina marina]